MTIPEHVIEAAAKALWEHKRLDETDYPAMPWKDVSDDLRDDYYLLATKALSAAFASLWQPIESAGDDLERALITGHDGDEVISAHKFKGRWYADHDEMDVYDLSPTSFLDLSVLPLPKGSE